MSCNNCWIMNEIKLEIDILIYAYTIRPESNFPRESPVKMSSTTISMLVMSILLLKKQVQMERMLKGIRKLLQVRVRYLRLQMTSGK